MTKEAAFINGFVKVAMSYGLTEAQAVAIFKKEANEGWGEKLQGLMQQGGQQVSQFAQQNPTAAGAIGGGLAGAAGGALAGGEGNRGKGALAGGLAGAGIGGGAGLAMDPEMQQKIMQLMGQGGAPAPQDAGSEYGRFPNFKQDPGPQSRFAVPDKWKVGQ